MVPENSDVDDIMKKYGSAIESKIRVSENTENYSNEYRKFKEEMAPQISGYEKLCKSLGNIVKVNVAKKDEERIRTFLEIAHLDIEPWQSLSLSVTLFIGTFLLGLLISLASFLITGSFDSFFFFLIITFTFTALFLFYFFNSYPERLANKWRLKASSQMVPAILYIVVYMRHTPNLEKAIAFASEHLQYPLALDFKKIFYNVQVGKFSTIKESLDNYLERWRKDNIEFIESFHLIESSLFEGDETRRIALLEKSLQVILDGVYDKMLRFTHDVRSPLTNIYMLGVVLPTLGLALLPLASAMVGEYLKWYHIIILFDLLIPFFVFYLTDKILYLRPGGHGQSELIERNPLYSQYKSNDVFFVSFLIAMPFFIIGIIPLLFMHTTLPQILGFSGDVTFSQLGLSLFGEEGFFGIVDTSAGKTGPFGVGSLILSMFIPLGIALFFSIAYRKKTEDMILEREKTKQLEKEFNNSLFQLGNRIGNGAPPEIAFGLVAESSKGLKTEDFFRKVNYNIAQGGMSVERAVFDSRRGVINYYPSDLIATSMKVLIEASKKGLRIAALSLVSISEYVKNIDKISERLRDMLAEIISDMKSNMTFLAPLLSGIVIGLSAMITSILSKLNLSALTQGGTAGIGNFGELLSIFDLTKMIPPYYLQIAIGIYIIEITFILTKALVTIDSGEDKLQETNQIAKNLTRGITLYFLTALLSTLALFALASIVLGNFG